MGMCDLDPSGDVPCSQKCSYCEGLELEVEALKKQLKKQKAKQKQK